MSENAKSISIYNILAINLQSHPIRMCGLKSRVSLCYTLFVMSHPIRMCGLKLKQVVSISRNIISHILYGCVD
jgi:hypothetical protein